MLSKAISRDQNITGLISGDTQLESTPNTLATTWQPSITPQHGGSEFCMAKHRSGVVQEIKLVELNKAISRD